MTPGQKSTVNPRLRRAGGRPRPRPPRFSGSPSPCSSSAGSSRGVGVSSGIVEGVARVLQSADFADIEPGEILVAPFTDPGWASVMFLSEVLEVDIGGALSHAAVVARELGLPCVVNTQNGTQAITTGDRIRVDGGSGEVTIL